MGGATHHAPCEKQDVLPCSKKVMVKGDKDSLVKLHSAGLGARYGMRVI